MFCKQYGSVNISVQKDVPKRGKVLCAVREADSVPIYMDHYGFSIPDGTNAYMFGNKLIVVTRWAEMSSEERAVAAKAPLELVFAPFRFLQGAMRVGNYGWSDITFVLYQCMRFLNDETRPVDSMIFLFSDKASGQITAEREVPCTPELGEFLRQALVRAHENAVLDMNYGLYLHNAHNDEALDFCDMIYNELWELSEGDSRRFRQLDPEDVPLGAYVTVTGDNRVFSFTERKE